MLFFDGGLALLFLGLWIFCIIDVITTPDGAHRHLPKLAWLLIVLLIPDIGSIAWLVAGRPWAGVPATSRDPLAAKYPEYDRPGRHIPTNPDDDEAFLAGLRARVEEQRRRAREERNGEPPKDEPS
jgi:hypothetical protein